MNDRDRSARPTRPEPVRPARRSRRASLLGLLALAAGLASVPGFDSRARAEAALPGFRVIVHPESTQSSATREFVMHAFLKTGSRWPEGEQIQPVDLRFGSERREAFSKGILGRSAAAVRNYWQQRIFTGRGVPPPEVSSDADVIRYVREHPGGIGYVSTQTDLAAVKVLALR
jgi:hypothetical protein